MQAAKREVTDEERLRLRLAGYEVKQATHGWYPVTPTGMAVLRGWVKTEQEAWWHCKQHYKRGEK